MDILQLNGSVTFKNRLTGLMAGRLTGLLMGRLTDICYPFCLPASLHTSVYCAVSDYFIACANRYFLQRIMEDGVEVTGSMGNNLYMKSRIKDTELCLCSL